MNNYFTLLISLINDSDKGGNLSAYVNTDNVSVAKINYISIFNTDLVDNEEESSEELHKQIQCFLTPTSSSKTDGQNSNEDSKEKINLEHINIIGLIRGINSLAQTFSDSQNQDTSIITGSKSTMILKNLETSYYIICSVSLPTSTGVKPEPIIKQLIQIIEKAHALFYLSNPSFKILLDAYKLDTFKYILGQYWQGFLDSYELENYMFPADLKWPNTMNYQGFLGLLGQKANLESSKTYKKSSVGLSYAARNEINEIIRNKLPNDTDGDIPKGLIISYFNKSIPKKYGVIYMNNSEIEGSDDGEEEVIEREAIVDIYQWLEYHDYHDKLDSVTLSNSKNPKEFFTSSEAIKKRISTSFGMTSPKLSSGNEWNDITSKFTPYSALELLNPISLTNNLVILPLNYTVNSAITFGGSMAGITMTGSENVNLQENNGSWMSVPYYLNPFGRSTEAREENTTDIEANEQEIDIEAEDNDDEPEDLGEYVIGLKKNENTGDNFIYTRPVYLDTKIRTRDSNAIKCEKREYLLVIYRKDDIYITLIYDSSYFGISEPKFYQELMSRTLEPAAEAIQSYLLGGSILGNSFELLPRSINGDLGARHSAEQTPDNDFFFVAFNEKDNLIQSSLPYLPIPLIDEATGDQFNSRLNKITLKYLGAIFHLHDQLIDLFITKSKEEFFNGSSGINEYLHKFNSNKMNDWMFYYVKYPKRYVIIIENRHHKSKKKETSPNAKPRPSSFIGSELQQQQLDDGNGYFFSNITDSVYDYANLGFLENLGDDVKIWLERFGSYGET